MRTSLTEKSAPDLGFTLLEIMVVVALIAVVTTFVIPHIGRSQHQTFQAKVREAVAVLNYARRQAVISGSSVQAFFFATEEPPEKPNTHWYGGKVAIKWRDHFGQAREDGRYVLTFFPEGGSTGGAFLFSMDELHALIAINPITGRVSVEPMTTGETGWVDDIDPTPVDYQLLAPGDGQVKGCFFALTSDNLAPPVRETIRA